MKFEYVKDTDLVKIIGKQGRNVKALRTIVSAVSAKVKNVRCSKSLNSRQVRHCREEAFLMIVIRITMNVPSAKQKELVQTLLSMTGPMEKETGCLSYAIFCDIEDKNLLTLLEEWRTRKDLDHHLRSEMFSVLLGTKSLLNEPHGIHIYTIEQSEGAEAVHAARTKEPNLRSDQH